MLLARAVLTADKISKLKVWVASLLCHPRVASCIITFFSGRIPNRGVRIDVTHECIPPEHAAGIFFGLYEHNEIRSVRRFLHRGLDVIEFGSGIGVVSAHILARLGKGDRLVCLEANPYLIPVLKRNIELNAPDAEVIVLNSALDYSARESISLEVDRGNLGSRVQEQPDGVFVQVKATTLHDVVREVGMGEYALVCDAEGAEASMILCDFEGLSRCQVMITELHPSVHDGHQYSVEDLRRKLEVQHGFSLVTARHGVHVFERPTRA